MSSLYDRAAVIPGRSLTRSKKAFGLWASDAYGSTIVDVDGNRYIDMLCGLGAISLGYGVNPVKALGVSSLPHWREVEAAEMVLQHVAPWASSVRFTKTGSEATHAAYRIAKAATGRDRVLMGKWAYHGWHEWCSDEDTCERYQHGEDFSDPGYWANVWGEDIAAVFVEPHRMEPVSADWLKSVRAYCDRIGALLVFDSMLYGGRWALGGASEYFGVKPDMETFGKSFGNGQAIAFVVGNQALAEHGELVSGTYSGDVTGLAAACDTIQTYVEEPVIETLWARGKQLQVGLDAVIPAALGVREGTAPVLHRVRFHDPTHKQRFCDAMKARGVLWHPDVALVMYAHTAEDIDKVIDAAAASVKEL